MEINNKLIHFGNRVLDNFKIQLRGSDRTMHQVNSEWKNLNKFNCIFNNKMKPRVIGRLEFSILKATQSKYKKNSKKMKAFP